MTAVGGRSHLESVEADIALSRVAQYVISYNYFLHWYTGDRTDKVLVSEYQQYQEAVADNMHDDHCN